MQNSPFNSKKSYNIEQLFILNLLKQGRSKYSIEKEFGISLKTLRNWEEREEHLRKMTNIKEKNNIFQELKVLHKLKI